MNRGIICAEVEPLLFALCEDEVLPDERSRLEFHLESCAACRDLLRSEQRLTTMLRGTVADGGARHEPRRRLRRLAAVSALAVTILVLSTLVFVREPAFGTIVSERFAVAGPTGPRIAKLGATNHVELPLGTRAVITLEGVASIDALGPVSFDLDRIDNQWRLILHSGRLTLRVDSGRSLSAGTSTARRTLESGVHELSASIEVPTPPAISDFDAAFAAAFAAFYESKDMKRAAELLGHIAEASHATPEQRSQALFYRAAALTNSGEYESALNCVREWAAENRAESSEVMLDVEGQALWQLGRRDAAREVWKRLLTHFPESPFRSHIEIELADDERDPQTKESPFAAVSPASNERRVGEVLWSVDLSAPSFGSAAAGDIDGDGGIDVVFGTYFNDETVYALRGRDGAALWKKKSIGGPFDASVLLLDIDADGKPEVFFGDSAYGRIFALSGDGKPVWEYAGPSGTDSPIAGADLDGDGRIELVYGTMKVKGGPGVLVILDAATGTPERQISVGGHVQSEPGLVDLDGDGVLDILVNQWNGEDRLAAFSGKTHERLWSFDTGDWIYHGISEIVLDESGKRGIVVADRRGNVFCLAPKGGSLLWKARLQGESDGMVFGPTTVVSIDGREHVVVAGRALHMLSSDGRIVWRREWPSGNSIARGVAAADLDGDGTTELVFGQSTTLRVLRADDGREIWNKAIGVGRDEREAIDHAPVIADLDGDGCLDVFVVTGKGTSDATRAANYGRAIAIRASTVRTPDAVPWPTFRGNVRRTGRAPMR